MEQKSRSNDHASSVHMHNDAAGGAQQATAVVAAANETEHGSAAISLSRPPPPQLQQQSQPCRNPDESPKQKIRRKAPPPMALQPPQAPSYSGQRISTAVSRGDRSAAITQHDPEEARNDSIRRAAPGTTVAAPMAHLTSPFALSPQDTMTVINTRRDRGGGFERPQMPVSVDTVTESQLSLPYHPTFTSTTPLTHAASSFPLGYSMVVPSTVASIPQPLPYDVPRLALLPPQVPLSSRRHYNNVHVPQRYNAGPPQSPSPPSNRMDSYASHVLLGLLRQQEQQQQRQTPVPSSILVRHQPPLPPPYGTLSLVQWNEPPQQYSTTTTHGSRSHMVTTPLQQSWLSNDRGLLGIVQPRQQHSERTILDIMINQALAAAPDLDLHIPQQSHGSRESPVVAQKTPDAISTTPSSSSTLRLPALLGHSETDELHLSGHQVFLRQQIEVFAATEDDVICNTRGRNRRIVVGQVGIRCRHCAHIPTRQRQTSTAYFPAALNGLYQAAQNLGTNHIQCGVCREMPECINEEFKALIPTKNLGSRAGRSYWAADARRLGLIDTDFGIAFRPQQDM